MEYLTEEQVKEFRAAFAMFDRDGDGFITTNDLATVMRSLGFDPTDAEIQDILNEVDGQGNGAITFSDFLTLMAKKMHETDAFQQMRDALKVFDRDGNGMISVNHFRQIMKQIGGSISETEISEMLRDADPYQSGIIKYEDFMNRLLNK